MKFVIIAALALVAAVAAAPQQHPEPPKILRESFNQKPEGGYDFGFETENGISRSENAELKQVLDDEKKPHDVLTIRGSYQYTDPEGKTQAITFYADENGYHAEGDAIPKVPARR